ncbi:sigma-54-dependent Fis family transcriptional regulator [bacterium]|nr:sigma-54-dependent Fis family transcriptional regulator [bacterium]
MNEKIRILIVDDEANMRKILSLALKKHGYEVQTAESGSRALEQMKGFVPQMIISDIKMDNMTGIEFIRKLRTNFSSVPVCFMTAYGSISNAVEAMKLGAVDYIGKPFEIATLVEIIEASIEPVATDDNKKIIGCSTHIKQVMKKAEKIAKTDATVMIKGETGVGKDLFARYIHQSSPRSKKPFIKVDCTSIPSELFESELFGHKKGSFTGAIEDRVGKFESAHQGTIFLDEIGTLNLDMQKKFLSIIQDRVLVRIGETTERRVDIRVITATNEDLEKLVRDGKFRKDLYFRLNNIALQVLPLRSRPEDIMELADQFLLDLDRIYGSKKQLSGPAAVLLKDYDYPGNIRELKNIIEQAYILSDGTTINDKDLVFSDLSADMSTEEGQMNLKEVEIQLMKKALKIAGNNYSKAAKILGINRNQLIYKLEKYGLK